MHDLKWIESNPEKAQELLKLRGESGQIDALLKLILERKNIIIKADELKQQKNSANKNLKNASKEDIDKVRESMKAISSEIKSLDDKLAHVEEKLQDLNLRMPNFPHPSVPIGESEKDNIVLKEVLQPQKFAFEVKDHVELGELTQTIDMERAAKVSGARFAFLKNEGSRLNRALMQFFLDNHLNEGDIELSPPYLVKEPAMVGTTQLPKFKEDAFEVLKDGQESYFLVPTAEVPVTNFHADEILPEQSLPLRYCAYSACFRAEAGAAGRDTKGMIRLHQFEKVEMVRFCTPENALQELDLMVQRASSILSKLELPHRIVELCTGDLGFGSEKTIDIEVFLPSQNTFREISSCSSFATFQARRAKIRSKKDGDKPKLVATLNGSGLPLGRCLVAIYENYQQEDGSIKIPSALEPYMGGIKLIAAKKN